MFRRFIVTAALVLGLLADSRAQFSPASNITIRGGFTPGFTDSGEPGVTNGTIRWNPSTTTLQFMVVGVGWTNIGQGLGAGFPLTTNADAMGFSVTNGGVFEAATGRYNEVHADSITGSSVAATSGTFGTLGTNTPSPEQSLYLSASGGHYYAYGPRSTVTWTDWLVEHSTSNRAYTYPGQLIYYSVNGNTYEATNTITHTNYYPHFGTTPANDPPLPTDTEFFRVFVSAGSDGTAGAKGDQGDPGAGNIVVGVYDSGVTYDVSGGGSNYWVTYLGDVFQLANTNGPVTGLDPTTTNWTAILESGASGTISGSTNWIYRGLWSALDTYTTNDVVTRNGNLFLVYTNLESTGEMPTVGANNIGEDDEYWDCILEKGAVGATGPQGADGNTINIYNYEMFYTNAPVNSPSNEARIVAWTGTNALGSNLYAFVAYVPVGTNNLTASNGVLWLNGVEYSPGSGGSSLTNFIFTAVESDTDAITWQSNDNEIAYFTFTSTNGASGGGGGGLTLWEEEYITNTVATGTWFGVTTTNRGWFVDQNGNMMNFVPDGSTEWGAANQGFENFFVRIGVGSSSQSINGDHNVLASHRSSIGNLNGDNNAVLGGSTHSVSGDGNGVLGGYSVTIANYSDYNFVGGGNDLDIGAASDYNAMVGGQVNDIDLYVLRSGILGGYSQNIDNNSEDVWTFGGYNVTVNKYSTNLFVFGGANVTVTDSNALHLLNHDLHLYGQNKLWLNTNLYITTDATTTALVWETLSPATTNSL